MQYRGYTIQEVGYGFIIRDLAGVPLVEVETVAEAQRWIDIEKTGIEILGNSIKKRGFGPFFFIALAI